MLLALLAQNKFLFFLQFFRTCLGNFGLTPSTKINFLHNKRLFWQLEAGTQTQNLLELCH